MGMVIRTNSPANYAVRNLNNNNKKSESSLEKLAVGYKIVRAADDASGLAISEKMRAQITQLSTYSDNAENGISLIQTAEGAMSEICEMLQRCVELSTKAANGIYSQTERNIVQTEIDQIRSEIDRVSDTANFNRILLLKGPQTEIIDTKPIIIGSLPNWASLSGGGSLSQQYTDTANNRTYSVAYLDCSGFDLTTNPNAIKDAVGKGFYTTCCTCTNHYSIEFVDSTKNSVQKSGHHYIYKVGIANCKNADDIYNAIIGATGNGRPNGHYTQFKKMNNGTLMMYDNRDGQKPSPSNGRGLAGEGVAYDPDDIVNTIGGGVPINVGYGKAGKIYVGLPEVSTVTLNVAGASVLTADAASNSIETFRDAVDRVSLNRGILGALQNRAEHTINNLNSTFENMSAAKSRLKDTDMAKEMSELTKNNVLMQASQAMIAQANTKAQNVLQLLQ